MKFLIITDEDADALRFILEGAPASPDRDRLLQRLWSDIGAPIDEIATELQRTEICSACSIEGQAQSCTSIKTAAIGRRLRRLVEIAKGERKPWKSKGHAP